MVTEKWSESEFTLGKSGRRVYEIDAANELQAAGLCPYRASSTHPIDSRLLAHEPSITTVVPGSFYRASVAFRRLGGAGTVPDEGGGDPLDVPLRWRWDEMSESRLVDRDAMGYARINSAGDRVDPLPSSDDGFPTLTIWRNEAVFDARKAIYYRRRVNDQPFTLPDGIPIETYQAVLWSMTHMGDITAESTFVTLAYHFVFGENMAFGREIDQGYEGWWQDGAMQRKGRFYSDGNDTPLAAPTRLDGEGKPWEKGIKVGSKNAAGVVTLHAPVKPSEIYVACWDPQRRENARFLRPWRHKPADFTGLDLF